MTPTACTASVRGQAAGLTTQQAQTDILPRMHGPMHLGPRGPAHQQPRFTMPSLYSPRNGCNVVCVCLLATGCFEDSDCAALGYPVAFCDNFRSDSPSACHIAVPNGRACDLDR